VFDRGHRVFVRSSVHRVLGGESAITMSPLLQGKALLALLHHVAQRHCRKAKGSHRSNVRIHVMHLAVPRPWAIPLVVISYTETSPLSLYNVILPPPLLLRASPNRIVGCHGG
jgi:hypothetical protein